MSDAVTGPSVSFRRSGGRYEPGRHPARGGSFVAPRRAIGDMDPVFWLTALLLGAALVLGGASADAAWQQGVLEILSLAVAGVALPRLGGAGQLKTLRLPLVIAGLFLLVPLIQLIPLPFGVWASLPGRGALADAMQRFGATPAFLPLSLTPDRTMASLLWLLIPIAVFLGVAACSGVQRTRLLLIVVAAGLFSEALGLLQLTHLGAALRFYDINNPERPVGLFANRNHQALFLLMGLPLGAALIRQHRFERSGSRAIGLGLLAILAILTFAAVTVSHSRAGLALAVVAAGGVLLIFFRTGLLKRGPALGVGVLLIAGFAGGLLILTHSPWFAHRLAATRAGDYRQTIWSGAMTLTERYSPLGSGIGSFSQVYMAVERPETLLEAYVNHAHNDFLETWVDAGYIGLGLALVFGVWILWRSAATWRSTRSSAAMGQAASVVLALAAAHSMVDFPARTPAIAAVIALACALLALPARRTN